MKPSVLIDAETLAAQLEDPRLRVFDCRFDLARPDAGRARYLDEHLPGAVYADLNRDLSGPVDGRSGRHPLPAPQEFENRLRAWGVNADSTVVAYDDGNGMYASRLWWMLRWLGHEAVAVLDGGMRRWLELDLPLTDAIVPRAAGDFVARPRLAETVDAGTVLAVARDPHWRVLDVRAAERYRGDVEPIDSVAGHVPGARNHPFTLSLDERGRFRPAEAIRATLESSLGEVPTGQVVAMCGSGVTACHLILAMEHAGLHGARLYAGSWSEWSSDPLRPVRTGPEP
jgi:thiosulfate/3-mercaptopyruvate sulfurtransferase